MLVGENGIITQAQTAAQETELKGDEEKIRLAMSAAQIANNGSSNIEKDDLEIALLENGVKSIVVDNEDGTKNIILLDSKKIYKLNDDGSIEDTNSDFDSIYVAPDSQDEARNEGVIGIGTDGQPVDMDLWEYTLLGDNTYALNDEESLTENGTRTSGYIGNMVSGKIEGTIPQYIKDETNDNFIEITNLESLFRGTNLIEAPEIPNTVTSLSRTFQYCSQLTKAPVIPNGVTNMYGTFAQCSSLTEAPKISSTVTNMSRTFLECASLIKSPEIPSGVTDMSGTFQNCSQLINVPEIPNTVNTLSDTFRQCYSLENIEITISDAVEKIDGMFWGCEKLSGTIIVYANVVEESKCRYFLANANKTTSTQENLNIRCTEQNYNIFYDEAQSNGLNEIIFGFNENNVSLTKI